MAVMGIEPKEFVDLGIYEDEQQVIEEGIRQILRSHPEYKMEIAVKRYKEEEISLGKAADIAGVPLEEMKEVLKDKGIDLKGPKSRQEVREDAKRAKEALE